VAYTLEGRMEGYYGLTAVYNKNKYARAAIKERRAVYIELGESTLTARPGSHALTHGQRSGGASSQVVFPMRRKFPRFAEARADAEGPFRLVLPHGSTNPGRVFSKSFLGNGANSALVRTAALAIQRYPNGAFACLPRGANLRAVGGRAKWDVAFNRTTFRSYDDKVQRACALWRDIEHVTLFLNRF
jgi:hypothetical protein